MDPVYKATMDPDLEETICLILVEIMYSDLEETVDLDLDVSGSGRNAGSGSESIAGSELGRNSGSLSTLHILFDPLLLHQ